MTRAAGTLRAQVLLLGVGSAALVLVLAAVPLVVLLRSSAFTTAEREAGYVAQGVVDFLVAGEHDDAAVQAYLDRSNRRDQQSASVLSASGQVLGAPLDDDVLKLAASVRQGDGSGRGPGDRDGDERAAVGPTRYADVGDDDLILTSVGGDGGQSVVVVALRTHEVDETVRVRTAVVVISAVALLLLAALAAEITSRRIVRPLSRAADTAVRLGAGDLTARAPEDGPREVARVAAELNALAGRIDELLTKERESSADLSHRLRTPLTAVRLGVEALPPSERKVELERGVDALERTLTQIIRAARRPQREGLHPWCDAAAVARARADFWRPLAEDQDRAFEVDLPASVVPVRAAQADLASALDALLENVVAHTPEGTDLALRLQGVGPTAVLTVEDGGPGIPGGAASRGRSDRGSSGLGLDIVRGVAEAAGGTMDVRRLHDRTQVRLELPVVADPQATDRSS